MTDWEFNSWGGKHPPFDLDNRIPGRVAQGPLDAQVPGGMVLEGGSIDVNGRGLLLTTEACLLNRNRNPRLTRSRSTQPEGLLGVCEVLWLGKGIAGDDTDGHVDDLTRFFSETGVLTSVERDRRSPNHRALAENLERLRSARTASGRRLDIVKLPTPALCTRTGRCCRPATLTFSSSTAPCSCRPSGSPGATGRRRRSWPRASPAAR